MSLSVLDNVVIFDIIMGKLRAIFWKRRYACPQHLFLRLAVSTLTKLLIDPCIASPGLEVQPEMSPVVWFSSYCMDIGILSAFGPYTG
jgi:hypothetical protein